MYVAMSNLTCRHNVQLIPHQINCRLHIVATVLTAIDMTKYIYFVLKHHAEWYVAATHGNTKFYSTYCLKKQYKILFLQQKCYLIRTCYCFSCFGITAYVVCVNNCSAY